VSIVAEIGRALSMAFDMSWEILWALILGFGISAVVQAVMSKDEMERILPDAKPFTILKACGLGAASSSCSYAAVAIARSIFKRGGNFTASMAFEFASTNLVVELGIILALLIGWQFTAAEFLGGLAMVFILTLLFRLFLKASLVDEAKEELGKGRHGKMEGHAAMDMSVDPSIGGIWKRLLSKEGLTATSHYFVMDVASVWKDVLAGILIAGAVSAWVPDSFWQGFFLAGHPGLWPKVWGALIGPLVSMLSFVCSIGNVPLAAVLWKGGISFGGVISFIFADLLILPILNIYRKYYGWRMMMFLFVCSYAAMVLAGLLIEGLFSVVRLIPTHRNVMVMQPSLSLNYTTVLNAVLAVLATFLTARFYRTGGQEMMAMMDLPAEEHGEHHCHGT
jgi:uncharacterized protein